MISDWQSSIRQADAADWVTVAAYLLAAMSAARAAAHAKFEQQGRDGAFWQITAVLLVLLGINELLDLQTLLTSIGRAHAKANGWYGDHRKVQYLFVVTLGIAAVLAGGAMLWLTRRTHAALRLALAGLVFIGVFILLRAASIHHFDELLGGGPQSFRWGSMQEMAGILMVAAAASLYARKSRRTL